jgi:hypothetical protein
MKNKLVQSTVTIRGVTRELKVGQLFRSFKELAGYFNIIYTGTSTNVAKAIEKDFNQFFKWEKTGRYELRISELFEIMQPRGGGHVDTYHDLILPIIAELMFEETSSSETVSIVRTNKQFYYMIGSCNQLLYNTQYVKGKWKDDLPEVAGKHYSKEVMSHVLSANHKKNSQIRDDLRKKLKQAKVVMWRDTYLFRRSKNAKMEVASVELSAQLMTASRHALTELRLNTMFDVYRTDSYDLYRKIAFAYSEEHYGVVWFKEANELTSTKEAIRSYILNESNHNRLPKLRSKISKKTYTSLCASSTKKLNASDLDELDDEDVSTLKARMDFGFDVAKEVVYDCEKLHKLFRYIDTIETEALAA